MQSDSQDLARECRARLEQHPIYGALRTLSDLRAFMAHHVYSVWDFMSLIKYLQRFLIQQEPLYVMILCITYYT